MYILHLLFTIVDFAVILDDVESSVDRLIASSDGILCDSILLHYSRLWNHLAVAESLVNRLAPSLLIHFMLSHLCLTVVTHAYHLDTGL